MHNVESSSAFEVPLESFGEVVQDKDGYFLGVPLRGPGDQKFAESMAEIARLEREARQETSHLRF
jgi:hypothetical protein